MCPPPASAPCGARRGPRADPRGAASARNPGLRPVASGVETMLTAVDAIAVDGLRHGAGEPLSARRSSSPRFALAPFVDAPERVAPAAVDARPPLDRRRGDRGAAGPRAMTAAGPRAARPRGGVDCATARRCGTSSPRCSAAEPVASRSRSPIAPSGWRSMRWGKPGSSGSSPPPGHDEPGASTEKKKVVKSLTSNIATFTLPIAP